MFQKLIKWLAKDIIQRTEEKAAVAGYNLAKQEIEDNKRIDLEFSMKEAIGKKIIHCSNEWEDPVFAVVIGITHITVLQNNVNQQPMLACQNVLTGEEIIVYSGSFYYADELLTLAILKLNPFERWNMILGKNSHISNMWNKWYPPKKKVTDPIVLEGKLREVGFLFKDKSISDWLVKCVNTFCYQHFSFSFDALDKDCIVVEKQTRNKIQQFCFSTKEEMEEFKQILKLE